MHNIRGGVPLVTDPDEPSFCEYDGCGKPLDHGSTQGRRRHFCNATCRSAARRQREASRTKTEPGRQLFARAVADALSRDKRPLRTLAAELPASCFISAATLSQWQTGQAIPRPTEGNQHRLYALERLLTAPPEALVGALFASYGQPIPRYTTAIPQSGGDYAPPNALTYEEARQKLDAAIEACGGNSNSKLRMTGIDQTFFVDAKRRPAHCEVTYTVEAMASEIQHYWVIYEHDASSSTRVVPQDSCQVGQVVSGIGPVKRDRKTATVEAVKLVLLKPLAVGELHSFTFHQVYEPTTRLALPEQEFRHFVKEATVCNLRLEVRFDPRTRPRELHRARWAPGASPASKPAECAAVEVDADGRAEPFVETGSDRCGYGFVWTWPSADEALP